MPNHTPIPSYPVLDMILDTVAGWVKCYPYATRVKRELAQCRSDEANAIAREFGVSPDELSMLASKGPASADPLKKMLRALHVEPHPRVMHDLQRLCMACVEKIRCENELAAGTAIKHFREFCPNATTLDALLNPGTAIPKHAS